MHIDRHHHESGKFVGARGGELRRGEIGLASVRRVESHFADGIEQKLALGLAFRPRRIAHSGAAKAFCRQRS